MNHRLPISNIVKTGEDPWPVGVFRGPDVDDVQNDFANGRWTLTGLATDHVIFSSSLLAVSGIAFEPVALYWEESNLPLSQMPYACVHDRPILVGLPPPLDATVYACHKSYADGLIKFLDRFAVRIGEHVFDSVKQVMPLVDWRLVSKSSVAPEKPPTVQLIVYGLEAPNVPAYLWCPSKDLWKNPIRLITFDTAPPKPQERSRSWAQNQIQKRKPR